MFHFDINASIKHVDEEWGINPVKQIRQMQEGMKHDFHPYDYYYTGAFQNGFNNPEDYVGHVKSKQLWARYPVDTAYSCNTPLSAIVNDKTVAEDWFNTIGIPHVKFETTRQLIAEGVEFVTKPLTSSHGGKGVEHHRYPPLPTTLPIVAQRYYPPFDVDLPEKTHRLGTIRVMMLAQDRRAFEIAAVWKLRYKLNNVDNYAKPGNGVLPIGNDFVVSAVGVVRNFNHNLELKRFDAPLFGIGNSADLVNAIRQTRMYCQTACRQIDSMSGALLGFDLIVTRHPTKGVEVLMLEVNQRPGFGMIQAAHRKGALSWFRALNLDC